MAVMVSADLDKFKGFTPCHALAKNGNHESFQFTACVGNECRFFECCQFDGKSPNDLPTKTLQVALPVLGNQLMYTLHDR